LIAEYPTNDPARESPIAQAYRLTYFERVRFCVRLVLWWGSATALHGSRFRRNEILMVPLRIARNAVPSNKN
jgi:hypothetical protein